MELYPCDRPLNLDLVQSYCLKNLSHVRHQPNMRMDLVAAEPGTVQCTGKSKFAEQARYITPDQVYSGLLFSTHHLVALRTDWGHLHRRFLGPDTSDYPHACPYLEWAINLLCSRIKTVLAVLLVHYCTRPRVCDCSVSTCDLIPYSLWAFCNIKPFIMLI